MKRQVPAVPRIATRTAALALAVLALVAGGIAVWGWDRRPNVVLVIGCTVRRDQLTPYGGPPETTPFLARLAAEGVRFDDAVATASWTREAAAGLLTGEPSARYGLPDPGPGINRRVLPDAATTIAERLRDEGYDTLGVTANPNLVEAYGMAQGFAAYAGTGDHAFDRGERVAGTEVVDAGLQLVDQRRGWGPFYLQLVLIDTHLPRATTPRERARFADEGSTRMVVDYRATLRRLDDALARLDEGLRARGLDDTWFVFVADHGEGLRLPAHHGGAHGTRMYRSTLAIPWIVRGPGVRPGVVQGLASGEDVAPTLLGLLGAPFAATGRDWSALVRGGGRTDRTRAFAMSMFGDVDIASVWTPDRVCQRDYGSLDGPMPDGCFDRAADPDATTPLADAPLAAELDAWRTARLAEGAAYVPVTATPGEDTLEQLRELGYLE